MDVEMLEYQKYLLNFGEVKKPLMPKFNELAYTDNEYLLAIKSVNEDFELIDDEYLTIKHLRGD